MRAVFGGFVALGAVVSTVLLVAMLVGPVTARLGHLRAGGRQSLVAAAT